MFETRDSSNTPFIVEGGQGGGGDSAGLWNTAGQRNTGGGGNDSVLINWWTWVLL